MENDVTELEPLEIDLSDVQVEELDVLIQDGSRGGPDFAASTACCNSCGNCYSCNA